MDLFHKVSLISSALPYPSAAIRPQDLWINSSHSLHRLFTMGESDLCTKSSNTTKVGRDVNKDDGGK